MKAKYWGLLGAGALAAAVSWLILSRTRRRVQRKDTTVEFDFGETTEVNAYFDRHPKFFYAFENLMAIADVVLVKDEWPGDPTQKLCFSLAHTCREDYLEIVFLATNGYGKGSLKLVRSLFERAVTVCYLAKHPDKTDLFLNFKKVQDNRALNVQLQGKDAEETAKNEAEYEGSNPGVIAQTRAAYQEAKGAYESRACSKCKDCKHIEVAGSWDIDLASMAKEVGKPFRDDLLGANTIANLFLHATPASALSDHPPELRRKGDIEAAQLALVMSTRYFLTLLRQQNEMFNLGIEEKLRNSDASFGAIWPPKAKNAP
jgi:Family of unknown function (DUF5677)